MVHTTGTGQLRQCWGVPCGAAVVITVVFDGIGVPAEALCLLIPITDCTVPPQDRLSIAKGKRRTVVLTCTVPSLRRLQ